MNKDTLLRAIDGIDDDLIEKCNVTPIKKKSSNLIKYTAIAACSVLLAAGAFSIIVNHDAVNDYDEAEYYDQSHTFHTSQFGNNDISYVFADSFEDLKLISLQNYFYIEKYGLEGKNPKDYCGEPIEEGGSYYRFSELSDEEDSVICIIKSENEYRFAIVSSIQGYDDCANFAEFFECYGMSSANDIESVRIYSGAYVEGYSVIDTPLGSIYVPLVLHETITDANEINTIYQKICFGGIETEDYYSASSDCVIEEEKLYVFYSKKGYILTVVADSVPDSEKAHILDNSILGIWNEYPKGTFFE